MKITRFEDLECWQQGRNLTNKVYEITGNGAFKKNLRLSGQIQAAATSVMANVAEGFVRRSDKEFSQFLFIAMSSAAEVQSHLYVALDQEYVDKRRFDEIYEQAKKAGMLISGMIKYLRNHSSKPTKQRERPNKQDGFNRPVD